MSSAENSATPYQQLGRLESRLLRVKFFITDLDQTSWDRMGQYPTVHPDLSYLLLDLSLQGKQVGVCTSREPSSVERVEERIVAAGIGGFLSEPHPLFRGPSVYSDGHIIGIFDGKCMQYEVLSSKDAREEMAVFKSLVTALWKKSDDPTLQKAKFGLVPDLDVPIGIPNETVERSGVFKFYAKGPLGNRGYPDYEKALQHFSRIVQEQGYQHIGLMLTANGDIIAVEKFPDGHLRSKRDGLLELEKRGLIDLSATGYFGDEWNDWEVALEIKSKNGLVFTPKNAIAELQQIADFVAPETESAGVAHVLRWVK